MTRALQAQNAVTATGIVQAGPERVSLRVSGGFTSEASLKDVNLRVDDRFFRLSDLGEISRVYKEPATSLFRFNGRRGSRSPSACSPAPTSWSSARR